MTIFIYKQIKQKRMNILINKSFNSGESIINEVRAKGRTMFSIQLSKRYTENQRVEIIDTISKFIRNGKKQIVVETIKGSDDIRQLMNKIESLFMSKYIKKRKPTVRKMKIKVGKKVTDIAIDKFYII